jgi:hypothetical protein
MSRNRVLPVVAAALAMVLAAVVWARIVTEKDARDSLPGAQAVTRAPAKKRDDQQRCLQACREVMSHYQRAYPATKTHDGDVPCWQECWRTREDKGAAGGTRTELHARWLDQHLARRRPNRCARTCWKKTGQEKLDLPASGFREGPK